jgi:hypothetical protein
MRWATQRNRIDKPDREFVCVKDSERLGYLIRTENLVTSNQKLHKKNRRITSNDDSIYFETESAPSNQQRKIHPTLRTRISLRSTELHQADAGVVDSQRSKDDRKQWSQAGSAPVILWTSEQ